MSLADNLTTPPATIKGPMCSIGALLLKLEDRDADALRVALDARFEWTNRAISDALRAEGHLIQSKTVSRHRMRECRCP